MTIKPRFAFFILPALLLVSIATAYFFEDVPLEVQTLHWETTHPGVKSFYQTGPIHTFFANGTGFQGIDAVAVYRQLRN